MLGFLCSEIHHRKPTYNYHKNHNNCQRSTFTGFPYYVKLNSTSNTTPTVPTSNATSNTSYVIKLTAKPVTVLNATAILPVVTAIRRRTPLPRSTASYVTSTPYVRGKQSNALELGISGRLLIWFLHFRGKIAATPAQTT